MSLLSLDNDWWITNRNVALKRVFRTNLLSRSFQHFPPRARGELSLSDPIKIPDRKRFLLSCFYFFH